MKIKRTLSLGSVLVISLSSAFAILTPQIASALAPYTCTWTGATNNNFNNAGNWSGCNSAAPQPGDGDNLVFDNTSLGASVTLTNDISSLQLGSITFQGSNSNFYYFTLTGNALTTSSGITQNSTASATINLDISLGADQTFTYGSGLLYIGDNSLQTTHTLALGSHTLTLSGSTACKGIGIYSALTGSGPLTDNAGTRITLNADSPGYTGAIAINSGTLNAQSSQALGATSAGTTVASGAALVLGFSTDTTFAEPLSLSGTGISGGGALLLADDGASVGCSGGGFDGTVKVATLSGDISLQSDVTVAGDAYHGAIITGGLSGAHTISVAPGEGTILTISSSSNTSNTPNGVLRSPSQTTTVAAGDNQPNTDVTVGTNQTYIIDGVRGIVGILSGGILKGVGTVGDVYVNQGGTIAPGQSPGCLNTGNEDINGIYQAELGGTTACSGYDQLNVTGTVVISGTTPATLTTSLYNGFKPSVGNSFTIINNDGADTVTGTFNNLPEGGTFTVSGYVFKITYKGGDGNDVVITVQSVPATPNTGFKLVGSNPAVTLLATIVTAGGILEISRRYKKVVAKR